MSEWTITVHFSPQLRTDGELVRVTISQRRGEELTEILLTEEQARSLVTAITLRLPSSPPQSETRKNG